MDTSYSMFTGLPGRCNYILFSCPPKPTKNVVFFQGDIQDLDKNMEKGNEEISSWKEWSLEKTHCLLQRKYPSAAIFIIRPTNTLRNLFSCYHNFVQSSIIGTPDHNDNHGAIIHLYKLLINCFSSIATNTPLTFEYIHALPLVVIGFSKGCVVLNQILYELNQFIKPVIDNVQANTSEQSTGEEVRILCAGMELVQQVLQSTQAIDNDVIVKFIKQIVQIYWLDAGHSGEQHVWITDKELLSTIQLLSPLEVFVSVSPLQINCPTRPWIGEEEKLFVSILKEIGINIIERIHFENEPGSLKNHFKILNEF